MTHSIHLDSSDLVGTLDEFESLEGIQGDFAGFTNTHVDTEVILPHNEDSIEMMTEVHPQEAYAVVKEEVVEGMETDDVQVGSETGIQQSVTVEHILTVTSDGGETLESSQDLFTGDIIEEVVGSEEHINEEVSEIYEEMDSIDHFEEEVITDTLTDQIEEVMTADVVNEETVIDDSITVDLSGHLSSKVKTETSRINNKIVTPGVYVVATNNNSNIVSAQSLLQGNTIFTQKDGKVKINTESIDTSGQTVRIIPGKRNAEPVKKLAEQPIKMTLTQARQIGLFTPTKLNTVVPATILPKPNSGQKSDTVPGRLTSVTNVKPSTPSKSQKILIRQGSTLKPGTVIANSTAGQLIRIPVNQGLNNIQQIQIPGKQVHYVKLLNPGKSVQSIKEIPLTKTVINPSQPMFKLVPLTSASAPPAAANVTTTNQPATKQETSNLVVLPSRMIQTPTPTKPVENIVPVVVTKSQPSSRKPPPANIKVKEGSQTVARSDNRNNDVPVVVKTEGWSGDEASVTYEANGIRPRKPCNCTRSMCLKLYCDCFANGEFCNQCNCTCCFNNLDHEEERQRAIKSCLERNPTAFRPKIGKSYLGSEERRHNKGCNCRRSGCLKNYCECYEAKIPCSKNCKCIGCKNVDSPFVMRREDDPRVMSAGTGSSGNSSTLLRMMKGNTDTTKTNQTSIKQAYSLMSDEVVKATCQCLLAQAEDWEREHGSEGGDVAQSVILEEFSRCVVQIIDCVAKSTSTLQPTT